VRLHWRRGQPIGLSGDEFTPPGRRAELLRGGQFALRISAFPFFSPLVFLRVPRVSPRVFSFSSSASRPSISPRVRPSVSQSIAGFFAFLSRGVSFGRRSCSCEDRAGALTRAKGLKGRTEGSRGKYIFQAGDAVRTPPALCHREHKSLQRIATRAHDETGTASL